MVKLDDGELSEGPVDGEIDVEGSGQGFKMENVIRGAAVSGKNQDGSVGGRDKGNGSNQKGETLVGEKSADGEDHGFSIFPEVAFGFVAVIDCRGFEGIDFGGMAEFFEVFDLVSKGSRRPARIEIVKDCQAHGSGDYGVGERLGDG